MNKKKERSKTKKGRVSGEKEEKAEPGPLFDLVCAWGGSKCRASPVGSPEERGKFRKRVQENDEDGGRGEKY